MGFGAWGGKDPKQRATALPWQVLGELSHGRQPGCSPVPRTEPAARKQRRGFLRLKRSFSSLLLPGPSVLLVLCGAASNLKREIGVLPLSMAAEQRLEG